MHQLSRSALAGIVLTGFGVRALAVDPVVEQHWVPHTPTYQRFEVFPFTDLPGSERTVTIPAGQAVLTWSYNSSGSGLGTARFRPVIGGQFPADGLATGDFSSAGTWSTITPGGTVSVKLQVEQPGLGSGFAQDTACCSLSWTLVVFPDAPNANVPAVGGMGLGVIAIGVAVAGSLLACRRRKARTGL